MAKSKRVSVTKRMRLRMEELGWTQTRLSKEVGASSSEVSRWLSGDRRPSLTFACRLAAALGIPVEELANDSEAKSA